MFALSSVIQAFSSPSASSMLLLGKATVLLLIAMIGTAALRRSSAGMRHLVWVVTLASLMLLPSVITRLPLRLAVLPMSFGTPAQTAPPATAPSVSSAQAAASTNTRNEEAQPDVRPGVVPTIPSTFDQAAAPRWPVPLSSLALAVWLWGLGVLACVLWLLHGAWSVSRIIRRAQPMNAPEWESSLYEVADRIGLEHAPRLVASRDVSMPFASGLLRPVIVLPHDATEWSPDRRTSVLLHELAHIKRRDLIGHTLGRLTCALYWFHPLVWTGARQLRIESERACDDIALRCGARPSDYAEHLLDIVTTVRRQFTPAVALAMAHRKEFEGRMLAILDPDVRRAAPSRRQTVFSVSTLAAMVLIVGAAAPAPPAANLALTSHQQPADTMDFRRGAVVERHTDSVKNAVTNTYQSTQKSVQHQHAQARDAEMPRQNRRLDSSIAQIVRDAAKDGSKIAAETVRELLTGSTDKDARQQKSDERAKLLVNVLKTDTSATVRRIAAWGLQEYADESSVAAALADALRKDASADVREMAAWALSDAERSRVAADALSNAVRSDADDKVRATAIWALGQAGDESSIDVLTPALSSKDDRVREMAMWAIGSIEPSKLPAGIAAGLTDPSPKVRRLTAWVLYQVGDPSAVPALESALSKETEPELRRAYVRALASAGEKSADALSKLLGSSDPEIRTMAVRALAGGNAAGPWPWPWPKPRPNP